MVETGAGGMSRVDFSEIAEDLVPAETNIYNIGLSDAQWAAIWVALAFVTSIAIGGAIGLSNVDGWLFINASTQVNGSMNISEDLFVNGSLTAGSLDITNLTVENMNFTNLTITGDIFNISATETYVNDLFPNEYCTSDLGSIGLRWDNGYFCHNVSSEYFLGSGEFLTDLPTGDNSSWNETLADSLYTTLIEIFGFNYYNSTDFSISDYFTSTQILGFSYYNSSDFSISDYFTSAQILGFGYYNSTDFSIADYFTSAQILGFGYYNSTDFDIADYLTSASIFGFGYYNSTDFSISDYFTSTQILGFNYWNSTHADFNKTYADTLYSTKAEPLWSANYTAYNTSWSSTYNATYHAKVSFPGWDANLAWINETNIFTANQNMTAKNISTIDCIIFDSGGEICSE